DRVELLTVDVPAQLVGAGIPLEAIGVEVALARRTRTLGAVADALGLIARAALLHTAMQHAPRLVDAVDVLQDVELADGRPVPVIAPIRAAERPERRPVAERLPARDVGERDPRLDRQHAARRRLEVLALGRDAGRRPVARTVPARRDGQVAAAVELEVVRVGGVLLDLPGAPVVRATRITVTGVDDPVVGR